MNSILLSNNTANKATQLIPSISMYIFTIRKTTFSGTFTLLLLFCAACSTDDETAFAPVDKREWLSGGAQTVFDQGSGAFAQMFSNLPKRLARVHEIGDLQFEQTFVSAPAILNPGLGPVFNNVSCVSCHIADGRGTVPANPEMNASMLFRVSLPGEDKHGGPKPVPGFGTQLQNQGILGTLREAVINIGYEEKTFHFEDGTPYKLRVPSYTVSGVYTGFPSNALLSPRVAPPVFGLGLLEAVSKEDVLSRADPGDANSDGISGSANFVWNVVKETITLGRFGWKANQPSLLQQVAAAYHGDIGITTSVFPKENGYDQQQYDGLQDDYELSDSLLHATAFYIRTLAVPARRNVNEPLVRQGEQLFESTGCVKCHIPTLHTSVNVAFPPISNQVIHPYTDMLLHDMGEDLADHRPDFKANGREWRTSPLWGIGLTQTVNGHHTFLHDGRARNIMEAILWHGGEAAASRDEVKALTAVERKALISFVKSL